MRKRVQEGANGRQHTLVGGLISVVRREHAFEIEELLERVLVLRIVRVLTRFYHHRIIGARCVSDAKGPRN